LQNDELEKLDQIENLTKSLIDELSTTGDKKLVTTDPTTDQLNDNFGEYINDRYRRMGGLCGGIRMNNNNNNNNRWGSGGGGDYMSMCQCKCAKANEYNLLKRANPGD
jgi:hypothetical protein